MLEDLSVFNVEYKAFLHVPNNNQTTIVKIAAVVKRVEIKNIWRRSMLNLEAIVKVSVDYREVFTLKLFR